MPGAITILTIRDRAAWETAAAGALPGQQWSHAAGLAADGWDPRLAVVEAGAGRMLLPFHLRRWGEAMDIATLPGLSGALIEGDAVAPLREWEAHAKAQGWVAGYLQLSALNEDLPDAAVAAEGLGEVRAHNALFIFDLATWDAETSPGPKMRNRAIRLGHRAGAVLVTDRTRIAGVFEELHRTTLARTDTRQDFGGAAIGEWLASPEALAFGVEVDGRIMAVQIGRRAGDWGDLHLAGAREEGRHFQPWLFAAELTECRAMGLRWVNIGGYGTAGDGLHQMKARLGAREAPLRSLRQVYDRARFAALCAATGADPGDAYFPPYRRPRAG
jgi:hypothetical protein